MLLILGCYDSGKLKYVGKVRAGLVPNLRCAMMPLLQKQSTDDCRFVNLPEKKRTLYSLMRGDAELPVGKTVASGADKFSRVDARRTPAARGLSPLCGRIRNHSVSLRISPSRRIKSATLCSRIATPGATPTS
jgi:hypothetical protein